MNHEDSPKKRKTIKIKLPRKPAAPRHPHASARAIALPNHVDQEQRKHSHFLYPLVQVTIATMLSAMVLDDGECAHVVAYAALGYVGGLLMMAPRRESLTALDEMLIRWGFVMLLAISGTIAAIIWPLRMHGI